MNHLESIQQCISLLGWNQSHISQFFLVHRFGYLVWAPRQFKQQHLACQLGSPCFKSILAVVLPTFLSCSIVMVQGFSKHASPSTCTGLAWLRVMVAFFHQGWSLTQFYSVDFSQSRIGVKKWVFYKCTIKVCVSCCWQCPGTFAPSRGHLRLS